MSVDLETLERNFNRSLNLSKKNSLKGKTEDEEATTVFEDLHASAVSKAASISPAVKSVTLGANSVVDKNEKISDDTQGDCEESFSPSVLCSSTPEKPKSSNLHTMRKFSKTRLKENSTLMGDKKISLDNNFSYRKLLSEFDAQRRLTVDKVMRERIQNMYDTSKLIRESLEHLKRTKLEEVVARRLLLETKILDEIHEQEILNKLKREAEWEKNNLKEAQRIQERNQKVKEAEEEAKKKSEVLLLKRKQVNEILFMLQKEYNQEYKNLLDTINQCKDKAALCDFTLTQSKLLKECATTCEGLLKKCKQCDVSNEDAEKAKKLVETIKGIHESYSKEIVRIQEAMAAEAKEQEKAKKEEPEPVKPVESSTSQAKEASATEQDSNSPKRSSIQCTSLEETKGILRSSSIKRKNLKAESSNFKKKSPIASDDVFGMGTSRGKAKITRSYMVPVKKSRKKFDVESDFFDKGDTHRVRDVIPRKQFKRVRFSESTEIINNSYGPGNCDLNVDLHLGSELLLKTENEIDGMEVTPVADAPNKAELNFKKYLSDCFDSRTLERYLHLKNLLENTEKIIEPLLKDEGMKKYRFHCQKAVNIPVNAISPTSDMHMSDKYLKLHNLLSGKTVEVGDARISATQHPLGFTYCKYLLAKKFVRQGDLTVSSKPDAAFSIAAVLASLWVDFPDFGELVLAHFQSACPYLAPVFLPQVEGQSDEDYHKSLGYLYSQNGEVEKQDSFLKRMSGIMRLYCAILISKIRQPGRVNPLGLSEGWRWISAILNLEPRPDICASLLYDFLEVAGSEMFKAYGSQFKKILAYICQEYFPKLEKVTPPGAGGPIVRLEGFLQKMLKEESIPPPHGALPPNFW